MQTKKFEERLREEEAYFHPVMPLQAEDLLLKLDLTAANTELNGAILADTVAFTAWVEAQLERTGTRYAVGGYNEHRTIYSRSAVFDPPAGDEPRRLHLGVDVWGPAGTPVFAPLEGRVHSTGNNTAFGDYGATLILEHQWEGFHFHSLYGHLSISSIQDKEEGLPVEMGQTIAWFGEPAENGQWPPHLHFQLIFDMEGMKGDYPGVCRYSVRERYLANCPNPAYLMGLGGKLE
jgi:murein DD-endopeptidase MepM/ murein hydrolase activator NlpD